MKSLEEVNAFMDRIAPNIHFSGRRQFTLAVYYTQEALQSGGSEDIRMTKDIYPQVARATRRALSSTERAIYRGAELCWMEGRNEALNHVIGRTLEQKPAPGTLLRYCAYYCAAGRSYHQEGAGGAPEPAGRG